MCVLGLEGTCFCLFGGGLQSGADLGVGFKFFCLLHTVGSAPECLFTLACFDCFTRCFPQGKFW